MRKAVSLECYMDNLNCSSSDVVEWTADIEPHYRITILNDALNEALVGGYIGTARMLQKKLGAASLEAKELHDQIEKKYNQIEQKNNQIEKKNVELEKLAMTDGLTGLFNRRAFDYRMREEVARANRSEHDFSLLFMDIDYFKKFNNTYGHQAGDEVLKTLAGVLNKRESDIVCRYGGEEFAIILPNTDIENALKGAYRLNREVAGTVMEFEDEAGDKHNKSINISIGVDGFRKGDSVEAIVKRADDNLYKAKSLGRNCVFGASGVYSFKD